MGPSGGKPPNPPAADVGTRVDVRGWLRVDLNDPAGASQRFADGDLNRAVGRSVAELSLAWPRLTDTEVVLAAATRTVPLPAGTFPGLVDVEEVEHPYGTGGSEATYPPTLVPFRVAPDRGSALLLVEDVPRAGARLRVRWSSPHAIQEGSTTLTADLDGIAAVGAAGYAMLAYSTPSADNFKYDDGATVAGADDSMIPREWRARASELMTRFKDELDRLRTRRALGASHWITWGVEPPAPPWPVNQPGIEP